MERAIIVCVALTVAAAPARGEEPSFAGLERGADAGATFQLNTFSLIIHEVSGTGLFSSTDRWWRPVRGKFRQATTYSDFYRRVGRPDLASREESRRLASSVMLWGGLGAMVGGGVLVYSDLRHDRIQTQAKIGAGLFLGGLISAMVSGRLTRPVVSEEEADRLATDYNRKLRLHLGLDPVAGAGRPDPLVALSLRGPW